MVRTLKRLTIAVSEIDSATSPRPNAVNRLEVTPPGAAAMIMTPRAISGDTGAGQMEQLLAYLARSEAEGAVPLGDALPEDEALWNHHTTLVVVTSSPRSEWTRALEQLARRRVKVAAVLVDGRSFGGFSDSLESLPYLESAGIPTYVVASGDDIPTALSQTHLRSGGGAIRDWAAEPVGMPVGVAESRHGP